MILCIEISQCYRKQTLHTSYLVVDQGRIKGGCIAVFSYSTMKRFGSVAILFVPVGVYFEWGIAIPPRALRYVGIYAQFCFLVRLDKISFVYVCIILYFYIAFTIYTRRAPTEAPRVMGGGSNRPWAVYEI